MNKELTEKYAHDLRRARKRLEETQKQVDQLEKIVADLMKPEAVFKKEGK